MAGRNPGTQTCSLRILGGKWMLIPPNMVINIPFEKLNIPY